MRFRIFLLFSALETIFAIDDSISGVILKDLNLMPLNEKGIA